MNKDFIPFEELLEGSKLSNEDIDMIYKVTSDEELTDFEKIYFFNYVKSKLKSFRNVMENLNHPSVKINLLNLQKIYNLEKDQIKLKFDQKQKELDGKCEDGLDNNLIFDIVDIQKHYNILEQDINRVIQFSTKQNIQILLEQVNYFNDYIDQFLACYYDYIEDPEAFDIYEHAENLDVSKHQVLKLSKQYQKNFC